ncbi:MAG: hypothetical protein PHY28_01275 [Dehalococcoidales bacterium]|nr:hypothetical protein [Dehalococcoidales bacterium]
MFSLILFIVAMPCSHSVSALDEAQWVPVNIPTEGTAGKWVLANGSDIRHLTMANDGTLYCYANPSGTTYTLFKSTDGGNSWTTTGKVTDVIIDIATLPQDAATIYYATASSIYKSVDGGNSFISLPPNPGGAGSGNISITSIDAVRTDNANIVAVSTADTDAAQFGGVYLLEENQIGGVWVNTGIGSYDVSYAGFSPNYPGDRQLNAVASDETDTYITSKINTTGWGQMIGNALITGIVSLAVNLAFPAGYSGMTDNAVFFAGIDTGVNNGDVYKITRALSPASSIVTDLNICSVDSVTGVDVASLAISGSTILAGCAGNARVYLSNDSGINWMQCNKPPTGQTGTCVLIAPDFDAQHKAYAVTCGTESAFSFSRDGGVTWNQTSLIDTKINDISDIATPLTTTAFMLTFNSNNLKHSLWRTLASGKTWERIFCGSFTGIDNLKFVKTIPQYSADTPILLVAGQKDSNPVIWKSTDNGQSFTLRVAPCGVDAWTIVDSNTWCIGGYDGSKGLVYRTTNGGGFYTPPVEAGGQPLTAVIASPDYLQDKTIVAGNTVGQVYLSDDNGATFWLLGQQLPLSTGTGRISLAFDSKFGENKTLYAITDAKVTSTSKERIFRFTLDKSTSWQSIYGSLPDNAIIKQATIAGDGTLYAVNTQAAVNADKKGGVVRSLNPTYSAPTFETMLRGLEDTVTLNKLSVCGNQLWTIDTKNTRLLTFNDSLVSSVTLVSPDDKIAGLDTANLALKWQTLSGATEYEWQVSDNTGFTGIPTGFTGTTESISARPTGFMPATTYYWRVRTSKPFLSRWSDTRSFTTVLGGSNVAPLLSVPEAGAKTTVKPIFQWGTIVSADRYDLLVAKDAMFKNIVIDRTGDNALPSNAWESDISLENSATYFWKVRACSDESFGSWSIVSIFVTETASAVPVKDEVLPKGQPLQQTQATVTLSTPAPLPNTQPTVTVNVNIPPAIIYGGIALLAAVVITLMALVIVTVKRRY